MADNQQPTKTTDSYTDNQKLALNNKQPTTSNTLNQHPNNQESTTTINSQWLTTNNQHTDSYIDNQKLALNNKQPTTSNKHVGT
jgi:hypothetical protein